MKTYISVLVAVVVLGVVITGGYVFTKNKTSNDSKKEIGEVKMKTFSGEVVRIFEGEEKLSYSFDIPESASTTIGMDGALIKITNDLNPYATIYISYERGRGFSPLDYISEVIAPHVAVINPTEVFKIGDSDWQKAESEGSEWYITSLVDGGWLVIVENKKVVSELVNQTLESLKAN